ncbi:protein mono-ADP-ribosyltransferase PARP14-like isoform X2 [Sceloporus undulatus]|uniref:protein mono-ADP-ribosyltransferase PARP14-like isoform X2 n=1 Tax=Sceloporus undulatus TaxID=8520 RepID=UPI001C4D1C6F|nr:protein mono-ADP-ribosyltransferase PARP14-like isoform X2 [Sceloporus undulatus]
MAGAEKASPGFPVIVRGDWGEPFSKSLKYKLTSYFQSAKRSGGGECKIHVDPGSKVEQVLVEFAKEEVRQSVLSKKLHELEMSKRKKLKLTVSMLTEEAAPIGSEPAKEPDPITDCTEAKEPKLLDSPENVTEELMTQEVFSVVVVPALGEEIEMDIMELYFENKKRSGGGPIKSCVKDGQKFIITFEDEADAQDVLQKKNHVLKKIALHVSKYQPEIIQDQPQMSQSLVVVEHLQETTAQCTLNLLVENVSDLSEDDKDFSVEMVPERNAAVISFDKCVEIDQFIQAFNNYHVTKDLNISARVLEVTKTILVENIPPGISREYIVIYFESKKYGGGPVLNFIYIPEENSARVTFQNAEDVTTILKQKHFFNNVPVLVYPYYDSLDTPLYGKERPQIKMPNMSRVSLDPYHWKFLQQNEYLLQEIGCEMAGCYCEIEWPARDCSCPEIRVHPSPALLKQKRSLIKTWNEDVSTHLTLILSKQKVVKCKTDAVVWEAIRNSIIEKADILILPDIPKGIIALVGTVEAVDRAEQELTLLIANAIRKIERERQTIEENVSVDAGKYTILSKAGLQERIHLKYPDLYIAYDASKKCVILRGVAAEVYKIKSDIIESSFGMVQKHIDVHPYVLLFLQHVSNELLSQLLFWDKNINALYELTSEKVLLMGGTSQDLLSAEDKIKKDLTYKCITLEDNSVIKMKEWKEMTHKEYNCSNDTIIIHELEDQVVIAGYFKAVADANQKLSDFIDANTYIQKSIRTKSAAVTMYVEQEKQNNWLNLKKQGVKIHFGTSKNSKEISLEGPRVVVLKALEVFQKILSSLHAMSVVVDQPGAKALFKEQEHLYVTGAKQQFNCLIRIQDDKDDNEEESEDEKGFEGRRQCCEFKLRNGIVVTVHRGDLTCFAADVVVNASNEELQHIGGLADALLKAAGPQLQSECNDVVRKYGSLKPGRAIITAAWNLPCKQVIHAVGPRWHHLETEKCVQLLKKAVRECLQLAETYNHRSIAIPAISSGIFGFPLKECAHSIVLAIKETIEESSENGSLKEICLVGFKEDTVQAFSDALNEVFVDRTSLSEIDSKWSPASKTKKITAKGKPEHQDAINVGDMKIVIQKKGIEDATTDVIVNSVNKELQLNQGPLSKALLGRAGAGLQTELTTEGQGKALKEGCVLKTRGYGLGCSWVLHTILPTWNQGQNSEDKIVGDVVEECLTITEKLSLNSITIPAIGTGNLGFPKTHVAKLMFDQVFKFSQKRNPRSLQEVHFVLHPTDTGAIQAFTDELNSRLNLNQTNVSGSKTLPEISQQQGQAFFGHISSASGLHKMQIGSLALQVECGDITQETTDAIVNITNEAFNLSVGVSKAILEGAGPEMATECAQLASQPHNDLICTKGGKLKCKNVIHLVANNDIKAQVSKALMECEQRKFISVAFPAIGTGKAGRDPVIVANDMIDAIIDYASNTSAPVVKNVKIIIFQSHLLKVFYDSMKRNDVTTAKPGASGSKSIFSTIAEIFNFRKPVKEIKSKPTLLLGKTIEPAIFQICGDSQKNVEAAASWVKNLVLKDQNEINFSDDWIANFEESEYKELEDLQRKLQIEIKVELEASSPSIHVHGRTRDVLTASTEIQKLIRKVRDGKEEQSKADLLSNLVEWQYEDNGQYKAFDSLINMQIEAAAQHQRQLEITIQNKCYRVDPNQQHALDAQGSRISLRRVAKAEDNLAMTLPEEWEDMGQMRVKVVDLNPEMKEYLTVKQMFCQTCNSWTVEKIERIQNPYYWQAYQIKKQEMDAKNGHTNNERLLFHGTASTSLTLINNSGFNRSYAGMHAAVYGNGTYFAVDASYSAHDCYSKPDANGKKYMYLARVLVGEYCVGTQGLVVPKAKSATDPTNLYDSVTDNKKPPSMFVIFNDIQAYPEYLITFTK